MKLLIIDDSEEIVKALKKSVKLIPEIKSSASASEIKSALKLLNEFNPDIIILDLILKDGTGLDLIRELSDDQKSKLIILYSNFLSTRYISKAKELGLKYYFDKNDEITKIINFIKSKISK